MRRTVLNYIGGDAWRDAGQWIEWDFDVPENGWYNITIKGRQTYNRGSVSSRILYLDGKFPSPVWRTSPSPTPRHGK